MRREHSYYYVMRLLNRPPPLPPPLNILSVSDSHTLIPFFLTDEFPSGISNWILQILSSIPIALLNFLPDIQIMFPLFSDHKDQHP